MLSPRFLRMQAEKCLRSALATTDLDTAADLKKMARDLENWANEAELENQRAWRTAVAGIHGDCTKLLFIDLVGLTDGQFAARSV